MENWGIEEGKLKKEEEELDDEYLNDNKIEYKGIFVEILKQYEGKKKHLKVSSFTHKNINCVVEKCTSRYVVLRKLIDNKKLFLSQQSIKDVEEI
jgi:hypothetical protein